MITVKACDDCNNAKSQNDDYLRDFLVVDNWVSQSPIAQQIFDKKMLSSQRQSSSVIAREAVKKAKLEPFYTNGGIYLGDYYSIPADGERIEKIFETFVRGLYYDSQKKRFPDIYVFKLYRHFPWDLKDITESFFSRLHPNSITLGKIFGCAFTKAQEDRFTSLWLFWFYERILFSMSVAHPKFL